MASFRQHGNGWQARVRRKGTPDQTKSFLSLQDAQKWSRSVEIEIDRGTFVDTSDQPSGISQAKWLFWCV